MSSCLYKFKVIFWNFGVVAYIETKRANMQNRMLKKVNCPINERMRSLINEMETIIILKL